MRQVKRAEQVKTGDRIYRSDGQAHFLMQVTRVDKGEAVKIEMADGSVLWAPCTALITVDYQGTVVDHDEKDRRPDVVHRSETQPKPSRPRRGWENGPGGVKRWKGPPPDPAA